MYKTQVCAQDNNCILHSVQSVLLEKGLCIRIYITAGLASCINKIL